MNNETDSKWSPKMLMTCAILLDIGVLSCLIIMPLLKLIQEIFKLIYLTIVSYFLFIEEEKQFTIERRRFFLLLCFIVCMNTNRSIDMGHVLNHSFIRDAKLSFESRFIHTQASVSMSNKKKKKYM